MSGAGRGPSGRAGWVSLLAVWPALLLVAALLWPAATAGAGPGVGAPAGDRPGQPADWQPTGLDVDVDVRWLASPPLGGIRSWVGPGQTAPPPTLWAWTADRRLLRSSDDGATWLAIDLPPDTYRVAVDPVEDGTLWAAAEGGLFKATRLAWPPDATATSAWTRLLDLPRRSGPFNADGVQAIAISPAKNAIVLVISLLPGGGGLSSQFTTDGGATWSTPVTEGPGSLCGWGVRLLWAHPTHGARFFRSAGCYAGRNTFDPLNESRDIGVTWRPAYSAPRDMLWPDLVVGGEGTQPARYYLAAHRDPRAGGSALLRSDDDAATWTTLLTTPTSREGGPQLRDDTTPGGLVHDPGAPDRVWLALNTRPPGENPSITGVVRASTDGGQTWTDLGTGPLPRVHALLLSRDARTLYAATEAGGWRIGVAPAAE